jgi:hypothetical protein
MKYKATVILLFIIVLSFLTIPGNTHETAIDLESTSSYTAGDFEVKLASMSRVETRTRNAAVKVHSPSGAYGSGAYFLLKGYHVIFTAAHVVDEGNIFLIIDRWGSERLGHVVFRDPQQDFAIILIPAFKKTKPLKLNLPQYNMEDKIGEELVFSGFPGSHNLTTIRGNVAGFQDPYFILHGAAWKGSSGSCVFDKKGNLTGILVALSVGRFGEDTVLIEDFIWVLPFSKINWEAAKIALKSAN